MQLDVTPVSYPKFRESAALKPNPNTAEPTFCTLAQDEEAWNYHANGRRKGAKLYTGERFTDKTHCLLTQPVGDGVLVLDIDQGPKASLATKVFESGYSRSASSWPKSPRFRVAPTTCSPNVGPGKYQFPRFPGAKISKRPVHTPTYDERPVAQVSDTRFRMTTLYPYTDVSAYEDDILVSEPATQGATGQATYSRFRPSSGTQSALGSPITAPPLADSKRSLSQSQLGMSALSADLAGRPQTQGELRTMLMRYQHSRAKAQASRNVRRAQAAATKLRDAVTPVDAIQATTRRWAFRTTYGNTSIDPKGHSIPTEQRFGDVMKARKHAANSPAPGQYHTPSSMIKKSVHKHDPRNDFPMPRRRRRRRPRPQM